MKILIVSQWCFPEPDLKCLTFAKELVRQGHSVKILTGFPNYPGGKIYPGYRIRPWQKEVIEGIKILRVPLYPSHDKGAVGRILNYASFAVSASVLGLAWARDVDVAYIYHPPATVALPALAFRLLLGVPCVYDIQDLWPDTLAATGMVRHPSILSAVGFWCRVVYKFVDRIVVLSSGFKQRLIEQGVKAKRVTVIPNWDATGPSSLSELPEAEKALLRDKFNVLFAGNIGAAQALDSVLESAAILLKEHQEIQFILVGSGLKLTHLKDAVYHRGLKNVFFLPRRPSAQMPAILAAADVLLVHLRDDPLFSITIPSKTQTYMAAGRPILMGVRGDAAAMVALSGSGVICEPENPVDMTDKLLNLREMDPHSRAEMGRLGQRYYNRFLSIQVGSQRFLGIFEELIPRKTVV